MSTQGDFEPLIDEATFYRAQAVLDGRVVVAAPRQRNHPDFPLRGFVRCETCGRPLTGSWSKGRNGRYAYYHCQRRAGPSTSARPHSKARSWTNWRCCSRHPATCGWSRIASSTSGSSGAPRRGTEPPSRNGGVKAIRQKLDRLDEAFLYSESIDLDTYSRQRDKLREELTLSKIDHHAEAVDELDVEGILAFAERILPRASDLWVQASLDYRQRLQELFFPEGIAFDGNRFNRTAVTAPLFKYLAPSESADERDGEPRRNRTENPQIKSLLLCQLS